MLRCAPGHFIQRRCFNNFFHTRFLNVRGRASAERAFLSAVSERMRLTCVRLTDESGRGFELKYGFTGKSRGSRVSLFSGVAGLGIYRCRFKKQERPGGRLMRVGVVNSGTALSELEARGKFLLVRRFLSTFFVSCLVLSLFSFFPLSFFLFISIA